MTIFQMRSKHKSKKSRRQLWFEKIMATVASVNLLLVIFDFSYIPLRDFWLQGRIQFFIKLGPFERELPQSPIIIPNIGIIANWYDLIKGIEPNRYTESYLKKVGELQAKQNQIDEIKTKIGEQQNQESEIETAKNILDRLQVLTAEREKLLAELRDRSVDMIDTNPFQLANKTGSLEKIKNRMRRHIFGATKDVSSKEAFKIFWSKEHLILENNFREELDFFQNRIQPLIKTNYYRHLGENGQFIDNFIFIDLPFIIIFGLEFLGRTWIISRRHTGVNWLDAMLWRWYDIFLFIPFFRWLRVIPLTIRLSEAEIIALAPIQKQISQGFVAGIAEDLTEVVVVRIINQIQVSIRQGEIGNFLSQKNVKKYVDINDTNETAEIARLVIELFVCQVVPKIRPEVEAILTYSIEKVIQQSPAYQRFKQLPGLEQLQVNLTEQIVKQTYQAFSDTLKSLLEKDPVFDELLAKLLGNLSQTMRSEIRAKESIEKVESLLSDLLEEIKINYVERLSSEDIEEILEQTRAIRQVESKNVPKLRSSR